MESSLRLTRRVPIGAVCLILVSRNCLCALDGTHESPVVCIYPDEAVSLFVKCSCMIFSDLYLFKLLCCSISNVIQ